MIYYKDLVKVFDGGEGSGHFNHVGIPNHKGGSARSGNFKNNLNTTKVSSTKLEGKNRLDKFRNVIKRKQNESEKDYEARIESYSHSMSRYTGHNYGDIKNAYRAKYGISKEYYGKLSQEEAMKASNVLDDYIYQAPKYEGEVYRGITLNDKNFDTIIQNLKSGKVIDMQGISSWSTDEEVAEDFIETNEDEFASNAILFKLDNKSGTPIESLSNVPNEKEVLHPTTARYKLKKIEDNNMELYYENGKAVTVILEEV